MLIEEITLRGLLSFGMETPPLPLGALNVLIGPNGSGKSNLLEAIGLLRSSPAQLGAPLRSGGGAGAWIWRGSKDRVATIEAVVRSPGGDGPVRHRIEFTERAARFELVDESIEAARPGDGEDTPALHYRFGRGHPVIAWGFRRLPRELARGMVKQDESILSQRNDPDAFPVLALLASAYRSVRLYREWSFGRMSPLRAPQAADLPRGRLEEDLSNFGLFVNQLRRSPAAKRAVVERLRDLYDGLDDFDVEVKGNTVEVFLTEGDFVIPAGRLSDGTLRYLALLAILCDPEPPPLIGLEEPELGLHPDLLPKVADMLVEASERTQVIVTTHSDVLVDAMSERPESVVVFEKREGATVARRLEHDAQLKDWLARYRLGELWTKGGIGGVRW